MTRALLFCALLPALVHAAEPRRLAVVVGSNTAVDGRPSLRYSHRDAQSVAEVLKQAGRFATADVAVLLDPKPADVLAALDDKLSIAKAAGPQTLLVFYYSGHADSHALFPGGEPLPIDQLKTRMSSESAGLRVGIIDACRGGGWTAAKGVTPGEPFAVGLPQLSSEGTVLLAASSGLEDAHEAESLQGSFFTHHLVAGLRGAADTTHDGQITLSEAFGYANRMTIRDTAMAAKEPQHPSFDMRLHGRQDIVLCEADASPSQLTVEQKSGPLQIVQLSTGEVVVEAPAGENTYRLALPPGDYLVRKVDGAQVRVRQVSVSADQKVAVSEASLELVGQPLLAQKGPSELPPPFDVAAGVGYVPELTGYWGAVTFDAVFSWRLTRYFSWRTRLLYSDTYSTGLSQQLTRDFGVLPSQLGPAPAFQGGTDLVFTFFRSDQTSSGFRFEASISAGPTAGAVRSMKLASDGSASFDKLFIAVGASASIEAAIELPRLPNVWVRLVLGTDDLWNDASKPFAPGNYISVFRFGATAAYRFGG